MARWAAWKRACDTVMHEVEQEIGAVSGLSGADFAVLSRLVELGDGKLRQQELARLLGWERSRLSRQISRMEDRDLVARSAVSAARMLTATATGKKSLAAARPAHATAVRRALLRAVPDADDPTFWNIIEAVGSVPPQHMPSSEQTRAGNKE